MNRSSKWLTPVVGLAAGMAVSLAEYARDHSLVGFAVGFAIICIYIAGIVLLRSRSETATLLAGNPVDERWASINQRALAAAAQLIALVLLAAFIVANLTGGDAMAYAGMAAAFALCYLGGILWFRWRS